MRNLNAAALTAINEQYGEEPINIIEVDWTPGAAMAYADKTIDGIPGKIIQLGTLDSVLNITNSNTSQAISLTLEDTEGSIKKVIDNHDVNNIAVRVYQTFASIGAANKFLIFAGKLNTPMTWSEATRSFSFNVVSQLENREFGFSAEEGEITGLPASLVGKPWPVVFGKALDVPALRITQPVSGSTLCGVGILAGQEAHLRLTLGRTSCAQNQSLGVAQEQVNFINACIAAWRNIDPEKVQALLDQQNQIRSQMAATIFARNNQIQCAKDQRQSTLDAAVSQGEGCNPLRVLGGEDFPQGRPIVLNVDGMLLTGTMNGQDFTISSRRHEPTEQASITAEGSSINTACTEATPAQYFEFAQDVPPRGGDFADRTQIRRRGYIICTVPNSSRPAVREVLKSKYADTGSRVTLETGEEIVYVASITPGTVLDVKAYRTYEGESRLSSVPPQYYSTEVRNFGTVSAHLVKLNVALSSLEGQGWSDDIFVTYESTIGPNTVDILEYVIDDYTNLNIDVASFATVKLDLADFPSNFAVLDRRNTIDLIKQIAFESRCATWVSDDTVYLKFLPKEPTVDQTITLSDTGLGSIAVTSTRTEEVTTKMNVDYHISYAEDPHSIVLRNNISKYGMREDDFKWLIYTNATCVYHAATFWLIRLSNMWKHIQFKGCLNLLQLENFDTVELDLPPYVASSAIKSVVQVADYDSASNSIKFLCEVPIPVGRMEQHPLYWPSNTTLKFPSAFDTAPGGGGLGAAASGELPGTDLTGTPFENLPRQSVAIGGPNAAFGPQSTWGKANVGDAGFSAGEVVVGASFAAADTTPPPSLDLAVNYIDAGDPMRPVDIPLGGTIIDIQTTRIIDSDNIGATGYLRDFIHGIDGANKLVLDTDAEWTDGTDQSCFDFKYDTDAGKWGAGTAFLQD